MLDQDMSLISQQVIRAIRGDKSQAWVNQRLGAASNLVHRWENGHAKASWPDFMSFVAVFKIDLQTLFKSYFRYAGQLENLNDFFSHIFANKKLTEIEAVTGISATKLRRLKNGETQTSLVDFLSIVFGLDRLESLAFIYDLTSGRSIPALDELRQNRERVANAYLKNPNIGLILVCLNLPSYKSLGFHQDSHLAKVSGIPIKEVNEILKFCYENGFITKEGELYKMAEFRLSDRGSKQDMINTRRFWLEKAVAKTATSSSKDVFGSIVFCTSQKAREEIIALYLRFFEDFKKIVDSDKQADKVPLLMNFQLFNPGEEETL